MSTEKLTGREALLRFSKEYHNNWGAIFKAFKEKKSIPEVTPDIPSDWTPITILDESYPEGLKQTFQPPFVFFAKGKMENLVENMLLLIAPKTCGEYSGISRMLTELCSKEVPIVIHWKKGKDSTAGEDYARAALEQYACLKIPFVVVIDSDVENIEYLAHKVAANGGLALTEHYPGSAHTADESPALRNTPLLAVAKAALLLGGREKEDVLSDFTFALDLDLDVGALLWPAFSPEGKVCTLAIQDGAAAISDEKDVLNLLEGNL